MLSTLDALEQDMGAAGIHSPALIVIGPTVALASCSPSALERSEAPLQGKGGMRASLEARSAEGWERIKMAAD
ncbi:Uncharacterised protein [Chromobacterium violaceum]|uniref:Uncharacterized protein n=1 Tax=Chromobacterium violaceum TaxID=536 RepID=A0A3S4JVL7_CHRVL|nr:Uncharacterised protein [Chromobacterium violaceum]